MEAKKLQKGFYEFNINGKLFEVEMVEGEWFLWELNDEKIRTYCVDVYKTLKAAKNAINK